MQASPALHPSEQVLQAFGNGQLDAASADAVCKHLDECQDCLLKVSGVSSDGFLDALRRACSSASLASTRTMPDQTESRDASREGLPRTGATTLSNSSLAERIPVELANHPDYEIRRELGRGGMGVVYLAHNRLMGRDEVLKVMGRQIIERPGVMDRFLREIRTVAQLRHPNIVTAYTAFRSGESLVFAMEYVDGLDLARMVKSRGPMPVGHACYFVHQAALGLQHAFQRGMVHRDIKPGNLMLARDGDRGVIKVLDFGLAKAGRENKVVGLGLDRVEDTQGAAPALTLAGQMLGTPDFIAPEQIDDAQSADIRADIYSLGCTLYYLLSGGPPFPSMTLYDVLQAHHSMDAQTLNLVRPEVPSELAALVAKMMAKDPQRRFQTPDEVAKALPPFFKKKAGTAVAPGLGLSPVGTFGVSLSTVGATQLSIPPVHAPISAPTTAAARTQNRPEEMWKSLIDFKEPEDIQPILAAATASVRKHPRRRWTVVAGLVGFLAILLAGITYRITTDKGELVIETEDPSIEVVVKQGGKEVTIIDTQTKYRMVLNSGNYELELQGDKPGLRLSTEKFTLKRGDKTIVTVSREPGTKGTSNATPPEAPPTESIEVTTVPREPRTKGTSEATPPEAPLTDPTAVTTVPHEPATNDASDATPPLEGVSPAKQSLASRT
jgi:serine/threonine protein kinase